MFIGFIVALFGVLGLCLGVASQFTTGPALEGKQKVYNRAGEGS